MDIFTTQLTRVVPVPIKPANLKVKALLKDAGSGKLKEDPDHLENHDLYFSRIKEKRSNDAEKKQQQEQESEKDQDQEAQQQPNEELEQNEYERPTIKNKMPNDEEEKHLLDENKDKPTKHLDIYI